MNYLNPPPRVCRPLLQDQVMSESVEESFAMVHHGRVSPKCSSAREGGSPERPAFQLNRESASTCAVHEHPSDAVSDQCLVIVLGGNFPAT
jgi:hypothetical protein